MKKVLAILTFALMTLAAVAAEATLNITASVKETKPEFIIKGGLTEGSFNVIGSQSGAALKSNDDISEKDIKVYVQVVQSNKAKYKKQFNLTITATPLTYNGQSASVTGAVSTGLDTKDLVATGSAEGSTVTYAMNYKTGRPVAVDTVIGTAVFTWTKNAALEIGDYTATITLGYTAP